MRSWLATTECNNGPPMSWSLPKVPKCTAPRVLKIRTGTLPRSTRSRPIRELGFPLLAARARISRRPPRATAVRSDRASAFPAGAATGSLPVESHRASTPSTPVQPIWRSEAGGRRRTDRLPQAASKRCCDNRPRSDGGEFVTNQSRRPRCGSAQRRTTASYTAPYGGQFQPRRPRPQQASFTSSQSVSHSRRRRPTLRRLATRAVGSGDLAAAQARPPVA